MEKSLHAVVYRKYSATEKIFEPENSFDLEQHYLLHDQN